MSPDFDEIVGTDGTPEELAELRQVHNLLLSADPPPLAAEAPRRAPRRRPSLRRAWAATALGFAAVLAALVAGLAIGRGFGHEADSRQGFVRPMHGIGAAAAAKAVVKVGSEDSNGNRTLRMTVRSLPSLPKGWYTLYLTEKGQPLVACGVFRTGPSGTADVRMNAPVDTAQYDGWIVTASVPGAPARVLLTT